jgi:uncharacterized protein YndB with AHSA1/START domain
MSHPAVTPSITLTRRVKADPESVFRAWTNPKEIEKWAFPEGGTFVSASVDLTVGGRYSIAMKMSDGTTHTAVGVYRVIDRPRKLVYTWDWKEQAGQMGDTIVTVEFRAAGLATDIVLTHERFPNAEVRGHHEQGWISLLNHVEKAFA